MSKYTARQVHLISRPAGMPSHDHFEMVAVELAAPAASEVLVKNLYMSVDPYMRGRMRAEGVYAQPYGLNEVMYGGAVGEVIESNDASLQVGDIVLNGAAWQDKFVAKAATVNKLDPFDKDRLSLYMGTLGMPGLTAYVGLLQYGEPKAGETVFVSAASGAVGANVCQIAKLKGCRVIYRTLRLLAIGFRQIRRRKTGHVRGACLGDQFLAQRSHPTSQLPNRSAQGEGIKVKPFVGQQVQQNQSHPAVSVIDFVPDVPGLQTPQWFVTCLVAGCKPLLQKRPTQTFAARPSVQLTYGGQAEPDGIRHRTSPAVISLHPQKLGPNPALMYHDRIDFPKN